MKIKATERGFPFSDFKDLYGEKCSIQKSSIVHPQCIWLGISEVRPRIMSRDAIKLGLREQTFDERDNGWVDFEIFKEVSLNARMHLTQGMVKKLLPLLQRFVETGEIQEL